MESDGIYNDCPLIRQTHLRIAYSFNHSFSKKENGSKTWSRPSNHTLVRWGSQGLDGLL